MGRLSLNFRNLGALVLVTLIFGCSSLDHQRSSFPGGIALGPVIASCSEGGCREAIEAAYFELMPETAHAIQTQGLSYFTGKNQGRDGTALQPWAASPLRRDDRGYTDSTGAIVFVSPMRGCNNDDIAPMATDDLIKEFDSGRAYYSTFNGGEGMLVVAPDISMAAYFYFN